MRMVMVIASLLLAPADPATLRGMLTGACLGVVEEVTGLPPWQARYLAPQLYVGCENDPLAVIRRLKGSVFAPEVEAPKPPPPSRSP